MTRRFRADIELGQTVLDEMQEAVAVFSQVGTLIYSNTRFARLWGLDLDTTLGDVSLEDINAIAKSKGHASTVWDDTLRFAYRTTERGKWQTSYTMPNGRELECRVVPIAGGATMIALRATGPSPDAEISAPNDVELAAPA